MPKAKQWPILENQSTHDLWVLAFKLRAEAGLELSEMAARSVVAGTLSLLGAVMNELRSRAVQGRLDV